MSDPEPAPTLETQGPEGNVVRVEFLQHGQRYTHRIVSQHESGDSQVLLEAVEDDLHLPWPCSPVFQGLNLDDLRHSKQSSGDRLQVAMLIGMSGDGHWSLAASATGTEMIFEAACRVRSLPPRLTSTYRVGEGVKLLSSDTIANLSSEWGNFKLRGLPLGEQTTSSCLLDCQQKQLQLVAEVGWDAAPPTTFQWRYGVSVV